MSQSAAERLASLSSKERDLSERMIRLMAEKDRLTEEYQAQAEDARNQFGTDDLQKLRDRFTKDEQENHARVDAYEKSLNELSAKLDALKKAGV